MKKAIIALVAILAFSLALLSGGLPSANAIPVGSSASGTATCTTDASAYCTVPHDLGKLPNSVIATSKSPNLVGDVAVDNFTATNFRVRAWGANGTLIVNRAITITWAAFAGPAPTTNPTTPPTTQPTTTPPTTAPTTNPPATAPVASTGGNWVSAFSDEFDGTSLNLNKWQPNWLGGDDTSPTKGVNDAEDVCVVPANTTVSGGQAHLALTAQSVTCNGTTHPYRSSLIQTYNDNITFTPASCNGECYFEAKLQLPASSSAIYNWPAFWATSADQTIDWPQGGENDIMEGLGNGTTEGDVYGTYHFPDGSAPQAQPSNPAAFRDNGWHTYGSQWSSNGTVRWYYDGELIKTLTGAPVGAHYLIVNYTQGTWGGPTSPGKVMNVDYVRAFKR